MANFKITNAEIQNEEGRMITFDIETELGKVEFAGEHVNEDKTVERIDSNLKHNLSIKFEELFEEDIPWGEIMDSLDEILETIN